MEFEPPRRLCKLDPHCFKYGNKPIKSDKPAKRMDFSEPASRSVYADGPDSWSRLPTSGIAAGTEWARSVATSVGREHHAIPATAATRKINDEGRDLGEKLQKKTTDRRGVRQWCSQQEGKQLSLIWSVRCGLSESLPAGCRDIMILMAN